MLTFNEIMAYEPLLIMALGAGLVAVLLAIFVFGDKEDKPLKLLLLIFGFGILALCGVIINGSTITAAAITPCSIITTDRSCSLVVDTHENLYSVCSVEQLAKLHVNQTRDVIILDELSYSHQRIVTVSGKYCPSVVDCPSG